MNKILSITGAVLIVISLVMLAVASYPTMLGDNFEHNITNINGKEATLSATMYEASGDKVVLLCGGFSSDRQMLRPLANMFVKGEVSAITFDYSGHGSSSGTVGFDNATNGQIAFEISKMIEYINDLGYNNSDIILLGHSMGGRSILELLTSSQYDKFSDIVLISPQINYDNNTQSSTFTGVTDSDIEPWQSLDINASQNNDILLVGSYNDDIVSLASMQEIYSRLSNDHSELVNNTATNNNITLSMVGGVFHSYETYSSRVANVIASELSNTLGDVSGNYMITMYLGWLVAIVGFLMLLVSLNKILSRHTSSNTTIELLNYRQFISFKLLMWLPALLVMVLIACLAVVMPFGAPIMSIAFIGGIAGYGIIMLIAYSKAKVKGVIGKIQLSTPTKTATLKNILLALLLSVGVLATLIVILRSGLYNLYPTNFRLFWLVFATVVMAIGFYINSHESKMLINAKVTVGKVVVYNLVQFMLLFLMAIAYLAINSYSGLIGLVQNLFLMYISIFTGNAVSKLTNDLTGSIVSAFIFQTTMLTATCLMVVF